MRASIRSRFVGIMASAVIIASFSAPAEAASISAFSGTLSSSDATINPYAKFLNAIASAAGNDAITGCASAIRSGAACKSAYTLSPTDLKVATLGLAFLGSGGGGALKDGMSIANRVTKDVTLLPVEQVDDKKIYVVAGGIGAPSALQSHIPEMLTAVGKSAQVLAQKAGGRLGGILSVETGAVNSVIAAATSSQFGIPLVDADGAGRSVPKLVNLTYAHDPAVSLDLIVLTSMTGTQVVIRASSLADAERQIRDTIAQPSWGNLAGLALWAQTGATLKQSTVIRSTYSKGYLLGAAILRGLTDPASAALAAELKNQGRLIDGSQVSGTLTRFAIVPATGFDKIFLTMTAKNPDCPAVGHTPLRSSPACSPKDGSCGGSRSCNPVLTYTLSALNETLLMQDDSATPAKIDATAPHGINSMVSVPVSLTPTSGGAALAAQIMLPLTNGDEDLMKRLAQDQTPIGLFTTYSPRRLYDFSDTFFSILKSVFEYGGGVVPPAPTQASSSNSKM
ncbi:MAG: DUF917 family protein [Deltaproteobacteria bacterium]|nr:DUF917 family protein [Deltaproteobacteria bacterium]